MAKAESKPQPKAPSGNPAGKVPIGGEGTAPSTKSLNSIPGETTRVVLGGGGVVRGEGARPLRESGTDSKD
jgi:hypothetical protein